MSNRPVFTYALVPGAAYLIASAAGNRELAADHCEDFAIRKSEEMGLHYYTTGYITGDDTLILNTTVYTDIADAVRYVKDKQLESKETSRMS